MVTGGAGFIGSYICQELLNRGHNVISYDLLSPISRFGTLPSGLRAEIGDITSLEDMLECAKSNKIQGIIAAAAVLPPTDDTNPHKTLYVNVTGIMNALEIQRLMELERVVFISSAGVYGKRSDLSPIDEDSAKIQKDNPEYVYLQSKLIGERVCQTYRDHYGLDIKAVRFAFTYGPGQLNIWPLNILLYHAFEHQAFKTRQGADYAMDLCYVKDAARGTVQAYLARRAFSPAYNISSGRLTSVAQVIAALKNIFPEFNCEIGPGSWPGETHAAWVRGPLKIERARSELGYSPQYDIEKALRDFVQHLESNPEHKSWPKNDLWVV